MAIVSANGAATPLSPNVIINGAMDIWQRGTSFTVNNNSLFTADRWQLLSTNTGGSVVASQQTFTPGSSPAPNFEGTYFLRNTASSPTGATYNVWQHRIEDVRTLSNQTVTLSFYAKADASRTLTSQFFQNFGTSGSTEVFTGSTYSYTLGTTWQRFTTTLTLPSISGKTIGAGSNLRLEFVMPINTTSTIDIWGVQLEAGLIATPFRRNANSIQGELAACQRYYFRFGGDSINQRYGSGSFWTNTNAQVLVQNPVPMRAQAGSVEFSSLVLWDQGANYPVTNITLDATGRNTTNLSVTISSGGTQYRPVQLTSASSINGYLGLSAEL
jgi:hypothetical protein